MVEIRIRADSVEVEGYVNAVERKSKPLHSRIGRFVERIKRGAFERAIARNDNIRLLLNHDKRRDLGGTKDGTLDLKEDSIGLRARATIRDPEVIEKARNGDLVGWSFGFEDVEGGVANRRDEDGMLMRDVSDMYLKEVSLLDKSRTPAYEGTLVAVRSDTEVDFFGEDWETEVEVKDETRADEPERGTVEDKKLIDYADYEAMIKEMKGE